MNNEIINAVEILQKQNAEFFYSSPYYTERTDRAIDSLLRNPHRTGQPFHLVRNALSDARKVMHRRSQLCPVAELREIEDGGQTQQGIETIPDPSANSVEAAFAIIDWLERAPLSANHRAILSILINGGEAEDVAKHFGLTIQQARVRISRVRSRTKALWKEALNV